MLNIIYNVILSYQRKVVLLYEEKSAYMLITTRVSINDSTYIISVTSSIFTINMLQKLEFIIKRVVHVNS